MDKNMEKEVSLFEESKKPGNMFDALDKNNRWIKMDDPVLWKQAVKFNEQVRKKKSAKDKNMRVKLGALIIQEKLGISDEEVVNLVTENPYMQYFLGRESFEPTPMFKAKDMKRFREEVFCDIKELVSENCFTPKDVPNLTPVEKKAKDEGIYFAFTALQNEVESLERENKKLKKLLEAVGKSAIKKKTRGKKSAKKDFEEPKEEAIPPLETLTDEQRQIYDAALNGKNLFITGGAGTGKSYLLRMIIDAFEKRHRKVLVGAPTGMAALHVGGVTLHRLFALGIGITEDYPLERVNIVKILGKKAYEIIHKADSLIIDEISMCRADAFSRIARVIQYEATIGHKMQVILCGDFLQLPPVVTNREVNYFKEYLHNPSGWAFKAKEWQELHIETMHLKKVIRQENPDFALALNKVRAGHADGLSYICTHASGTGDQAVTLCGSNRAAQEINESEMRKLGEPVDVYNAEVLENDNNLDAEKEIRNVTEPHIRLCDGARVIITVNDPTGMNLYHNGSMGVVVDHQEDSVLVFLDETQKVVRIRLFRYSIYDYKLAWDKGAGQNVLKKEVIFSFTQIPLRLGWAITIHKSQGQTYDHMILDTDSLWRMDGLLYVALSRVTDTSGLRLNGSHKSVSVLTGLLKSSPEVLQFYLDSVSNKAKIT